MEVKIKRLWHGVASIRDYQVGQAIEDKEDLEITLLPTGERMTIPFKELHKGKQNTDIFHSIHVNFDYTLIDFIWKVDKTNQIKLL